MEKEKVDKEKKLVDSSIEEITNMLNTVSVKDTKLKDITIRVGSKILKYEIVSNADYPLDKEIREEYSKILSAKMKEIHSVINSKFNDTLRSLQMAKEEYLRKEQVLLDKLKQAAPMPLVTLSHARKGLSIVKGDRSGEIVWLVRRTYRPKTVDFKAIQPNTSDKMVSPIYIMVITSDNKITSVTTRKIGSLDLFQHYHQANPDCWGKWKYNTEWRTPDDIIKIADEAEAVLENVNSNSIAKNDPAGLPTITSLKRQLMKEDDRKKMVPEESVIVPVDVIRTGTTAASNDVWSI